MRNKCILIIAVLLVLIIPTRTKSKTLVNSPTHVVDTAAVVFLFQGKEIPSNVAIEMLKNNEITMFGTDIPKEALIWYGEKYRNGLFICVPVEKESNEQ